MSHTHDYRGTIVSNLMRCRCGSVAPAQKARGLDAAESRELRDQAIVAVDEASSVLWKHQARRLGIQIAQSCDEFTPDEFWRRGLEKPREGRALGPVLLWLAANSYIEKTDRVKNTEQVRSHAAPVSIWRSKARIAS